MQKKQTARYLKISVRMVIKQISIPRLTARSPTSLTCAGRISISWRNHFCIASGNVRYGNPSKIKTRPINVSKSFIGQLCYQEYWTISMIIAEIAALDGNASPGNVFLPYGNCHK